jgi:hypothetical protein
MTTPRVTELPRRLEPSSPDTFLGTRAAPAAPAACDTRPLATVVQLRPRDPLAPRRRSSARGRVRTLRAVPSGPGPDSAA